LKKRKQEERGKDGESEMVNMQATSFLASLWAQELDGDHHARSVPRCEKASTSVSPKWEAFG